MASYHAGSTKTQVGSRRKAERCRRYKTPSPQLLRIRREAANARERRRMNNLNVAFEQVAPLFSTCDEHGSYSVVF